jgi:hypothetical protein
MLAGRGTLNDDFAPAHPDFAPAHPSHGVRPSGLHSRPRALRPRPSSVKSSCPSTAGGTTPALTIAAGFTTTEGDAHRYADSLGMLPVTHHHHAQRTVAPLHQHDPRRGVRRRRVHRSPQRARQPALLAGVRIDRPRRNAGSTCGRPHRHDHLAEPIVRDAHNQHGDRGARTSGVKPGVRSQTAPTPTSDFRQMIAFACEHVRPGSDLVCASGNSDAGVSWRLGIVRADRTTSSAQSLPTARRRADPHQMFPGCRSRRTARRLR